MNSKASITDCDPDNIEPDHSLITWEKWAKIRKEQTKLLGEDTHRPPADLAMNLLEKVREDKERKTALEHAQIKEKPANSRGTLWEQPQRLAQCCHCEPVYEVQRTSIDMGHPPVIEHIGVPKILQESEKGLTGLPKREACPKLDNEYILYRDVREKELEEKIKEIDPYRPCISELIVIGHKPKPPVKKLPNRPLITITTDDAVADDVLSCVTAIRINNTVLFVNKPGQDLSCLMEMKKESWHEACNTWTYYFNVSSTRAARSKLFLENLGTVTLLYCWKKVKKPIPYIPDSLYDQVFFFNKNEDVLSPGQRKEIFFTFISPKPGIYSEFWEISFKNIYFFESEADRLIINLHADSLEPAHQITKKVEKLRHKIKKRAIFYNSKAIISEIIDKALAVEPEIYPYKKMLLEGDLFVSKNHVCFYHQTEVATMKKLYTEMLPHTEWDLSITSWRRAMMDKDFEMRMNYYDLLKHSHRELLKPWYEGESLRKQKHRSVYLLLRILADKFDSENQRISSLYELNRLESSVEYNYTPGIEVVEDPLALSTLRNVFYVHMLEHVATTMEQCAGVLSSLDLNRWLDFDFCRW